jgi:uncharacterized protein
MFTREVQNTIDRYLTDQKIILMIGARQVGKTTLLKHYYEQAKTQGRSVFYLNLERDLYLNILNQDPENLFQIIGPVTQLTQVYIDEIQYLNDPSSFLKYIYDEYRNLIKLIVTGSSAFYIDQKFDDSLAGRKHLVVIYPLSFKEYLHFTGYDHIIPLIAHPIPLIHQSSVDQLWNDYVIYGWYPEIVLQPNRAEKQELLAEIWSSYIKKDIVDAGVEYRDVYIHLMQLLADQTGNLLNLHELANTLNVAVTTVQKYVYIMKKSFHIGTISPFFSNKRKEITKMPKVYFLDTGLRNYFVRNFEPIRMRNDYGSLLENMMFKTLLIHHDSDDIHFWRNNNKNEVDFVIDRQAREVKQNLGSFKLSKYQVFSQLYPSITLQAIDTQWIIQLWSS